MILVTKKLGAFEISDILEVKYMLAAKISKGGATHFILSLGSPQLGKCYQGVTAPERLGTADIYIYIYNIYKILYIYIYIYI